MCCRGKNSRRGFGPGPRCGHTRNLNTNPEGHYEQRPGPRGLFGFLAAKRAEKKAARDAFFSSKNLPDTKQSYGYVDQRGLAEGKQQQQQQQQGVAQWENEKQGYENFGFQEQGQVKEVQRDSQEGYENAGVRSERLRGLNATLPRYSMVMRE